MGNQVRFLWTRVIVAIFGAELLPVLLLIGVVVVFASMIDQTQPGTMRPEEFAPLAGNWVGPIGGFVATFLMSYWTARAMPERAMRHGLAVGAGTAMLDLGLGVAMGGDALPLLFLLSNCGRVLAGALGGAVASRGPSTSNTDGR